MGIKVVSLTVAISDEILEQIFMFIKTHSDHDFTVDEVVETAIKHFFSIEERTIENGRNETEIERSKFG